MLVWPLLYIKLITVRIAIISFYFNMTQDEAFDILKMGQNVFLTGPAGSGKTFLLNKYIKYLQDNKVPVAITASTGIAATHMNGRTIHSWSGIKIRDHLTKKDMDSLFFNDNIRIRIGSARVLIIDEISMLDAKRFDLVNMVCQRLRKNPFPFGGLQVIACGDFFQLPPVQKQGKPKPGFCFSSQSWGGAKIVTCYLEKQYRQNDERFLDTLNAIRGSTVNEDIIAILRERFNQPVIGFSKPTKLYTHNNDVDAINDFELRQIQSEPKHFYMTENGDPKLVKELKKSCLAPQELILKKGAFVMFVKNNFDKGFVNGTLGNIVEFDKDEGYPIVQTKNCQKITACPESWVTEDEEGNVLARISQVPLRLAWAVTVHKSQGMSLDCAEIDLSKAFTEGMGYVALSRVRTLAGIKLMGLNQMALKVNPLITEVDVEFKEMSRQAKEELTLMNVIKKMEVYRSFLDRVG